MFPGSNSFSMTFFMVLTYPVTLNTYTNVKIARVYGRFGHVHYEDKGGRHRRSVHIFVGSHEIDWSLLQLHAVFDVLSHTHAVQGRVEVAVSLVQFAAEIANPLLSTLDEPDERVHVGAAVLATNYWLTPVWYRWDCLSLNNITASKLLIAVLHKVWQWLRVV